MAATVQPSPPRSLLALAGDLLVFIGVLVLLYFAYLTTRPVLVAIVLAAAVASLARRFFNWLTRRLHGRRRLAAVLAVFAIFIGVFAPFAFLATVLIERLVYEGSQLAHNIEAGGPLSVERLASHLGPLGPYFERSAAEIQPKIMAAGPQIAHSLGSILTSAGHMALRIGIGLFLVAVALYYIFLDGQRWRERAIRLVPLPPADTRMFFDRFHRVSVAVIVGNVGTALAQATAATLGYFIFGAPVPLIWGAATLFAALIPLVGPALVWIPVAFIVTVSHGALKGGGLALWGVLVVSTIDNVVRPLLTKRGLQLHPLLVFVSVFGGMLAFGFLGIFIGPLVMALMVTMLDVYERHVTADDPRMRMQP